MRQANKGAERWLGLHGSREDLQRVSVAGQAIEERETLLYHKKKPLQRLHLPE